MPFVTDSVHSFFGQNILAQQSSEGCPFGGFCHSSHGELQLPLKRFAAEFEVRTSKSKTTVLSQKKVEHSLQVRDEFRGLGILCVCIIVGSTFQYEAP